MIEPGAKLERSLVRGPAVIGAGARIVDSYVGPYTSIDADVEVVGTEVEHSILLAGASVTRPAGADRGEPARQGRQAPPAARGCRRRCG